MDSSLRRCVTTDMIHFVFGHMYMRIKYAASVHDAFVVASAVAAIFSLSVLSPFFGG